MRGSLRDPAMQNIEIDHTNTVWGPENMKLWNISC